MPLPPMPCLGRQRVPTDAWGREWLGRLRWASGRRARDEAACPSTASPSGDDVQDSDACPARRARPPCRRHAWLARSVAARPRPPGALVTEDHRRRSGQANILISNRAVLIGAMNAHCHSLRQCHCRVIINEPNDVNRIFAERAPVAAFAPMSIRPMQRHIWSSCPLRQQGSQYDIL